MELSEENILNCPENFDFPFPPYEIQRKFMMNLYKTINEKKFGIFESPTGTGKSLSIICGSIRWLKDFNKAQRESLEKIIKNYEADKEKLEFDSKDWLTVQSKIIEINEKLNLIKLQRNKIIEYDKKIEILKEKSVENFKLKFKKISENNENVSEELEDEDLMFEDVLEEDEHFSDENDDEENSKYEPVKIYICSRTHSQLSQFVGEILKSPFGKDVRAVSLASRQIYCVNPQVKRLKSMALINEKCLDMQKNSKKTQTESMKVLKKQKTKSNNCKCQYFNQNRIEELSNFALNEIKDVEDLVSLGGEMKACPYYSSRKAANDAEIILIPYNTLLHKSTREANGISLKNNVVIIDEAHNLLEALAQMYNTEISFDQLDNAMNQLKSYKTKFSKKFSPKNLLIINQLIFVISKLVQKLEKFHKGSKEDVIFDVTNFVTLAEIDNFNIFNLVDFVKRSKLSQKIHSYALKYPTEDEKIEKDKKGVKEFLISLSSDKKNEEEKNSENVKQDFSQSHVGNPFLTLISFLESLTYSYDDGRILIVRNTDKKFCKFQFLLLNPSINFKDIVKEARSVIVAGGTMKPITEFRDRLFINSGVDSSKIVEFTCDHIIPPENILPIILTRGQKKENLLFNYENRLKMGDIIRTLLQDISRKIPGGIVVFFPSYQYENWFWLQCKNVNFGKPIFREPKNSNMVEEILENYSKTIKRSRKIGAIMFSVVGGKLSEGLNFSDDLGRCVVVVGLPYSNIQAADLREKMKYLDKKEGTGSGYKFYENSCMKSVNQCIGRAVRHKNDFASVILLDERYNRSAIKNSLPAWIKRSLKIFNEYDVSISQIEKFFQDK